MATAPAIVDAFVGRRHELEAIRAALHEALSGSGRLILLSGEAGIGKSRLAEELAQEARANGVRIAWGRCWEGGGAPPYWPWVQIIREVARHLGPGWLTEMGAPARYVAQMVPELRTALPAIASAAASHGTLSLPTIVDRPEQARFQLFDSISTLLRSAASSNPLFLVIDDLHAADADSLLFLDFFARDLPQSRILAIGTYRENEVSRSAQHSELLGRIVREARCFPLRGLSREEISEFIQRHAGLTADRKLVESLSQTTEGSPFFLNEIVRMMKAEGRLVSASPSTARFSIPESIRPAVHRKLAPLGDKARFALTVASVIGSEFEFALLERTSDLSHDHLVESLEQATALGVLHEAAGAPVIYRFGHAIVPEVLRAEISKPRLLKLHERVANEIERLHHGHLDDYATALAFHYRQVLFPADGRTGRTSQARLRKKLANYARRGAERSTRQLAYDDAAKHYRMALEALGGLGPKSPQQIEMLLGLGAALRNAGSWSEARQAFAEATEIARGLGVPELLARAALAASESSTLIFGTPADAEMMALLREALDAIGDHDSGLRARLLARLAEELVEVEHRDHALALCQRAIEIARRVDDPGALVSALWTQHQLHWGPHDIDKRLESANEIIRLAEKAGGLDWSLRARQSRLTALIELGRIYQADREIEACAALEQRAGQSTGITQRYRAMRCLMRGDFAEAERYAMEVLDLAQRLRDQGLETSFGTLLIQIRWEQGRAAETEPILRNYVAQFPSLPIARCGLADAHARMGREAEAREEFERLASDDFSGIPRDWNWIVSLTSLAGLCTFLRDERRAATLYDLLRPYGGRNVTVGWGNVSYGSVEHWLGRLAGLMGRFDQAEAHFNAALRFDAEMGAAPLVAHTRHEYGAMLLQRGRSGDREQGLALLRPAADTASALGMRDLEQQVRSLISNYAGPRSMGVSSALEQTNGSTYRSERAIASVLFTDLVSSTERASELKDRKWVELLQRFHQEQRKEVVALGGRQINTAGDGMLAVFNHPSEAIRCAFAIVASAGRLGLEVRSGIHTGECEFVGGDVAGIAVHIGARVAAHASAGEVMVSSTVRDLLSGGELTFEDRGLTALKGIPGEWRLYAVEKRV
jgi:eukaryotic-like serine/threonine-protein kinase